MSFIKENVPMAKKIVVASGKGGVGKSSVTVGLAKALAKRGKSVLIIDCDTLCSIDMFLGVGEEIVYNWGDVILKRCDAENAIYNADGVSMMTCPKSYNGVSVVKMKWLLSVLDERFDYIFLDSPAGVDLGFILACNVSDRGIVVSTPDPVCVRSACAAADEMRKYSVTDVRLIINRLKKSELRRRKILDIDTVIDKTEVQLIGVVPEDDKILHSTMGGSIYKRGQVSYRAFNNIASRIEGESIFLYF